MSIEGQGHFFTIYLPGFVYLCFTRPRYQVSIYRTNGPLVLKFPTRSHRNLYGIEIANIVSGNHPVPPPGLMSVLIKYETPLSIKHVYLLVKYYDNMSMRFLHL